MAIDHSSPESEAESRARLAQLVAAWRSHGAAAPAAQAVPSASAASLAAGADATAGAHAPACGLRQQVGPARAAAPSGRPDSSATFLPAGPPSACTCKAWTARYLCTHTRAAVHDATRLVINNGAPLSCLSCNLTIRHLPTSTPHHPQPPACHPQVALLFGRSLRQVLRDRATNAGRASSQVSSALVFASIYWRMRRSQSSIQDRMGLLQISAVGTAMTRWGAPAGGEPLSWRCAGTSSRGLCWGCTGCMHSTAPTGSPAALLTLSLLQPDQDPQCELRGATCSGSSGGRLSPLPV